jgi:Putative sensor/HAAS
MPETTADVRSIEDYLQRLKEELAGSDPALIQDALYDAEEYLRQATGGAGSPATAGPAAQAPSGTGAAAAGADELQQAIQRFGTPREVAEAYHETEIQVAAAMAQPAARPATDPWQKVFGVFLDPRAYGSLLYMFLSLATGILYFTWAVTGLSLSLGLSVLIIGLPFFLFFLASIRLFALLEGRLVESLLGVRMPRRPQFASQAGSIWARLRVWLRDGRTWTTLLYMVLKLPLGIFSFVIFTVLTTLSLALLAAPVAQLFIDHPVITFYDDNGIYATPWLAPIFWLAGLLDLLVTMHLARALGRVHGAIVKAMLVRG